MHDVKQDDRVRYKNKNKRIGKLEEWSVVQSVVEKKNIIRMKIILCISILQQKPSYEALKKTSW